MMTTTEALAHLTRNHADCVVCGWILRSRPRYAKPEWPVAKKHLDEWRRAVRAHAKHCVGRAL